MGILFNVKKMYPLVSFYYILDMNSFESFIQTPAQLLMVFFLTVVVTVISGVRLSQLGDALAERLQLDAGIIGALFLAAVTSLPELAVSLSALLREPIQLGPDLAVGNMLGSNLFNLLILGIVSVLFSKTITKQNQPTLHRRTLWQSLLLLLLAYVAFSIPFSRQSIVPLLHCSWLLLPLPIIYGWCMVQNREATDAEHVSAAQSPLAQQSAVRFYSSLISLSLIIILAGVLLSSLGGRMALPANEGGLGLQASLIGTLFLALATSLPELVIAVASLRFGFADMALGNILGSNLFNLLILFVGDVALRHELLFEHTGSSHGLSFLFILTLSLMALGLLRTTQPKKAQLLGSVMVLTYLISLLIQS